MARNDSLTRHLWNEHKLGKPQEQVCNICGNTIQGSKSKLIKHVNERHKGKNYSSTWMSEVIWKQKSAKGGHNFMNLLFFAILLPRSCIVEN